MKDNKVMLVENCYQNITTLCFVFSKYLEAYKKRRYIDIWGVTVINEPHGNGNNWESTLFSPEEMTLFVQNHLGPKLEKRRLECY